MALSSAHECLLGHKTLKGDLELFCSRLKIIGEQCFDGVKGKLLLGNCPECHSTISYAFDTPMLGETEAR